MTSAVNLYRARYDVYIGRAGKGQDGYFGNPVRIGATCTFCGKFHADGGSTLPCFTNYFLTRLEKDPEFKRRIVALKGKTLGCFCKPKPCHGDVIAAWVEKNA